ncbi:type II toxin-antitoxin system HipA family toxin [Salmonella bongori]|uniref:type II toxin-antitoxin system HipA family toxin n=1 Tax=Salmonella bongori TaxID=54736 RepID=UPI0020A676AF|nr:HipA domain-containing protein [Salmonella bongori]
MVVNALAVGCGLNVAAAQARKFASDHHCFMVCRFDRTDAGQRLHFASAMTLTRHQDGDDYSTGVSYLELAEVLIRNGAQTKADLQELWSRIVFNILVSNSDNHLRNHGFILVPGKGWRLSEAYDINPVPRADGLKLNITEADNALDMELAREVAEYFRLKLTDADEIIASYPWDSQPVENYCGQPYSSLPGAGANGGGVQMCNVSSKLQIIFGALSFTASRNSTSDGTPLKF